MKVLATNLGKRKTVEWKGKTLETGIFKSPVSSIFLGYEDPDNDAVVDRRYHGGVNKAVYVYGVNHYSYWKERFPDLEWDYGMFGENLSIENLDETKLYIGATYKVGEAIIEVSEPREPCVKLGMRFNNAGMVKQFWNTNKCGAYFKVLKPGNVRAGDQLELLEDKPSAVTIAEDYQARK